MRRSMRSAPHVDGRWLDESLHRAIPQLRAGAWEVMSREITRVRARWSSQVVFCRLTCYEQGATSPLSLRLVVKSGPHVRDGVEVAALETLAREGMRSPSRFQVPRLLGFLADDGVMAQLEAPGTSLRALLGNPRTSAARATSAVEATARWLTRFQSLQLDQGQVRPVCAEPYESIESLVEDLRLTIPRQDALSNALDRAAALRPAREGKLIPSHGDFHPGQALVGPRLTTTVVDFETFGWRAVGFDVGTCLAQFLAMAWFDTGDVRPGVSAAQTFWEVYAREGCASWAEARFHSVRALLQVLRFALASPPPDARELRDVWAWLIAGLLSSDTPDDLWRLLTRERPRALPSAAGTARVV